MKLFKKPFCFLKNIFSGEDKEKQKKINENNENENKSKKEKEVEENDKCLDLIVDKYLRNEYINIPLLPNAIEKYIYRAILRMVINFMKNDLNIMEFTAWNHVISFDVSEQVLHSLTDKNNEGKKDGKTSCKKRKFDYINLLVSQFLESDQVDIPGIPKFLEMALYKNIIVLIFSLVEDVITSTSFEFMGHTFEIHSKPTKACTSLSDNILSPESNSEKEKSNTIMKEKEPIIDDMVEKMMKNDVFLIPDFIERRIYKTSLSIIFYFIYRIINDFSMQTFMHKIDVRIHPDTTKIQQNK